MQIITRAVRSLTAAFLIVLVAAQPASAEDVPWLYENSDVPPDKDWNFGKLDNDLRYAVRRNGVPPDQVSIRIRVDVGSLYETDDERGYAHFLEHLLFRQSKYLGDGKAIAAWQRLGASFGSDTNAETSTTQTVYKIDLPNATPTSLNEAFRLLSGMVTAPTLSAANLRADLPIVLAEMRERGGASKRVQEAMRQTFYEGQPLAERSPIGTVETLNAATSSSVKAFYSRWYRPANVVIIAAGDAPPEQLEALITKWFSGWKVRGRDVAAPSFGDPVAPAGAQGNAPVGSTKVVVEPDLPLSLNYTILRPWRQVNDTIVYNQGLMADALAEAIINRRLESRARMGGSYLVAHVNQDDVSRSADATFISVTPLDDDWQRALAQVRAVIADALVNPPTQLEIERETAELDVAFQVPVEQRRLLPGSRLADDLVTALDIRETVAAPDDVLRIFRGSKPLFTPDNILAHTKSLFTGTVTRALLITPNSAAGDSAALRTVLTSPVEPDSTRRLAAKPIKFEELPPIGNSGRVESLNPTGLLGIDHVSFANGVQAMLWPVAEEPGRVTVKVRFGGGYGSFKAEDAPYIALGEMALVSSGMATLGQEDLDWIATGRKMGFEFSIKDAVFEFSAETRPADLADQLYLFAAKLDMPLWDPNPVVRARAASKIQYEAFSTSPQGILNRDLSYFQHGRDLRFVTPTPAELEAVTPEGFRAVWEPALKEGPIEIQIFGDFDKVAAVQALQRSFGALKPRETQQESIARGPVRMADPSKRPILLSHRGDPNQAATIMSWPTGGGSIGIPQSRQLELLSQLFSNRLMEAMREKMGASYSPFVYSTWPVDLSAGGAITAIAQVDPGDVDAFFATADEIAADLIANPPDADELGRVLEPMRQQVTRAASSSAFFMNQIAGATRDPARIAAVRTILRDYTETTPQKMQALAALYLGPDKSWRLAVLPESQVGGTASAR